MQLSKKIETNINPIVAMRRLVNLKPNETKNVFLVNAVGDYEEEAYRAASGALNRAGAVRLWRDGLTRRAVGEPVRTGGACSG